MQQGRHCFKRFLFLFFISYTFLFATPWLSAEIEFDPNKLIELEGLQREILDETKTSSEKVEVRAIPKKGLSQAPSQSGVIRVQDDQLAISAEAYQEQLEILSKEEKSLLERISLDVHTDINYDSNVFAERNPRGDIYYSVGPNIRLDATELYKGLGFFLNYSGEWGLR